MLVSRPGDRARGCRRTVRRLQPGRQASDLGASLGGPPAGVLQLQAVSAARISLRRCLAFVCVWLWIELHELRDREPEADKKEDPAGWVDAGSGGCDQRGQARGNGSCAAFNPRPGKFGDAAGEGAKRLPKSPA